MFMSLSNALLSFSFKNSFPVHPCNSNRMYSKVVEVEYKTLQALTDLGMGVISFFFSLFQSVSSLEYCTFTHFNECLINPPLKFDRS